MKYLHYLPLLLILAACDGGLWNNPYPVSDKGKSIYYSAFTERPKHLDPVSAYSENEYIFLAQIYQPPLQYHFLKRPYTLVPQAASEMPTVRYLDKNNQLLPDDAPADKVAFSVYEIHLRSDLNYQPHPAFARDAKGELEYHALTSNDLRNIHSLNDFPHSGTREVKAADYVYQIKRLAHPTIHSPIAGLMVDYIVGLKEYIATLQLAKKKSPNTFLDLRDYPLEGVQIVDDHTYRIKIYGKYPQFAYWLAMTFFSPMPVEAERFYAQDGMSERNLILDWWPVGSGPYYLSENDPNQRMVLTRNPHFSGEVYPTEGEAGDKEAGLLADAGKPLPLIGKVVFSLEKETIPYWNKFLQGYYDAAGISSDSFDQAVQVNVGGETNVTDEMKAQGIKLSTSVATSTSYMGFNWLDPVVGGASERATKLRRAISIAVDFEEFISIFANGRGISAQSPIPPGIFGYREGKAGINHYVYDWVNGKPQRKSINEAKKLLAEAGYLGGLDEKTKQPLIIYLDTTATGVGSKSRLDWLRKQLDKLNLQLVARSTDYNRFQDKIRKGDTQMFYFGWNADYPDPENFLFLLHGAQGKVAKGGENASNYNSPEYDRLFEKMKNMENGPARQEIIDEMLEILRRDSPWIWGQHPKDYALRHAWIYNSKPNKMANNNVKYLRIDAAQRDELRSSWNQPKLWPLWLMGIAFALLGWWLWRVLRQREEAR
ncbi:MAG: ABC-type oligopeptide transport system, substrate-binding protein [Candidatus Nitrotoga sp. SPKER]|nr:MAG: ABC-type oligopeptide transport system, substrate-binding protein [Candidatus Nitrotoga sp. SPKER]